MNNYFNKFFLVSLFSIIFFELLSLLAWNNIFLNKIFFIATIIAVFILSLKKLEWGIYIIFAELFIGSKGYLLSWPFENFSFSIRLGLFLVIFLVYFYYIIKDKKIKFFSSKFYKFYLSFIGIIIFAIFLGYCNGNNLKDIFLDCNGYLFLGLIFPITQAIDNKKKFTPFLTILFAASLALILKTLILLLFFSHSNFFGVILIAIYKWIRDTGVGEITTMPNGFSRIFFQSHIYIIIAFFIAFSLLILTTYSRNFKKPWLILTGLSSFSLLVIFLSYSRSFWLGFIATLLISFFGLIFYFKLKIKKVFFIFTFLVFGGIVNYFLAFCLVNIPLPGSNFISASALLSERTQNPTQEAAGSSRLELLKPLFNKCLTSPILGMGYGTTVSYKTKDPRALEQNPDGNYTTFAFEWGYLDLWLKFGLFGIIIYFILLWQIFKNGFIKLQKSDINDKKIYFGTLLGFLFIMIIHFFTPYLNHPLGLGWIVLMSQLYSID